jgi:hypothetical protein
MCNETHTALSGDMVLGWMNFQKKQHGNPARQERQAKWYRQICGMGCCIG